MGGYHYGGVDYTFQIRVSNTISELMHDQSRNEIEFPNYLSRPQRQYIYGYCFKAGLTSKMKGPKNCRIIYAQKKTGHEFDNAKNQHLNKHLKESAELRVSVDSIDSMRRLYAVAPITHHENYQMMLLPNSTAPQGRGFMRSGRNKTIPPIPPHPKPCKLADESYKLPAWAMKRSIMETLDKARIMLISGETGSGKTTQVPKMILEQYATLKKECKIICTQPRRIAAVSVSQRIAEERGEVIGDTVGYQIRLESKMSPQTSLVFCTMGVLLRTMMGDESFLDSVTHVIVDEVHERDRLCDFLLIVLKLNMQRFKHLTVILMSANLDADLYSDFFGGCPVIQIAGRMYPVEEFYLEDIIKKLNYISPDMMDLMAKFEDAANGKETSNWTAVSSQISPKNTPEDDWATVLDCKKSGTNIRQLDPNDSDDDVLVEDDEEDWTPQVDNVEVEEVKVENLDWWNVDNEGTPDKKADEPIPVTVELPVQAPIDVVEKELERLNFEEPVSPVETVNDPLTSNESNDCAQPTSPKHNRIESPDELYCTPPVSPTQEKNPNFDINKVWGEMDFASKTSPMPDNVSLPEDPFENALETLSLDGSGIGSLSSDSIQYKNLRSLVDLTFNSSQNNGQPAAFGDPATLNPQQYGNCNQCCSPQYPNYMGQYMHQPIPAWNQPGASWVTQYPNCQQTFNANQYVSSAQPPPNTLEQYVQSQQQAPHTIQQYIDSSQQNTEEQSLHESPLDPEDTSDDETDCEETPTAKSLPSNLSARDFRLLNSRHPDSYEAIQSMMDESMFMSYSKGGYQYYSMMLSLIEGSKVSVDYQHPVTQATALMVFAGRGQLDFVKSLLCLGASVTKRSSNGWTAYDWAQMSENYKVMEYLAKFRTMDVNQVQVEALNLKNGTEDQAMKDAFLLEAFSQRNIPISFYEMLIDTCKYIHNCCPPGGILIFLPGYQDISELDSRLYCNHSFDEGGPYEVFWLHSSMHTSEQQKVFRISPTNVRKIVLSTNIAETSVTIQDIVYVIDSGKFKELTYDAIADTSCLLTGAISQASATQRRGRAGRCQAGQAYHLFSKVNYLRMQTHQTPEILRTPLQDLCLQAKLLASGDMKIADFLAYAPQPPSVFSVANAVESLKRMDALDQWENVTDLGRLLAQLPLTPHLAKMVLYATIFQCLDPVVTIASFVSQRDPFRLPMIPGDKNKLKEIKYSFSDHTQSDHYMMLHCFYAYRAECAANNQHRWCKENFISIADMETIAKTKKQVLATLYSIGWLTDYTENMTEVNRNSYSWPLVKAMLVAGMYPKIVKTDTRTLMTEKLDDVEIESRSAVFSNPSTRKFKSQKMMLQQLPTDWLVYEELFTFDNTSRLLRNVTPVSDLAIFLFGGPLRIPSKPGLINEAYFNTRTNNHFDWRNASARSLTSDANISLDSGLLNFNRVGNEEVLYLRYKVQAMILRKLSNFTAYTNDDVKVIHTLVDTLTMEDQARSMNTPNSLCSLGRTSNQFSIGVFSATDSNYKSARHK